MENVSKRELFETVPVQKALFSMAIPTVISQLINLVYNVVDSFFIGRTGNSYMVAAVTVSYTLFMLTAALSNLFGVGGGSLMARLAGKHEDERARTVSAYSVFGAIAISLLYSTLVLVFLNPLLRRLGASDQTIGFARQYTLVVVVLGNLPVVLSTTLAHLLRNSGYSKQASFGVSMGGLLNIALDPLFMFYLLPSGYEVLGAAIATVISNIIACIYLLCKVNSLTSKSMLSLKLSKAKEIVKEDIQGLYKVGVPSALLTGLFDLANIFLNVIMSTHGDLAVAAIGICMKVERLPNCLNLGICQGMLPIVAYNYSSGDRDRMKKTINTARLYGIIVDIFCITVYQLFTRQIVGIFLNTGNGGEAAELAAKTLDYAGHFLRIRCCASFFQFMNYHSSFTMQAIGDGKGTLLHCCVREFVFYIPFMFLFNQTFGIYGLTSALLAGELCGGLFALYLLNRGLKRGVAK